MSLSCSPLLFLRAGRNKCSPLISLNSSNLLSDSAIVIGTISFIDASTAADKGATLDDLVGGLGLRSGAGEDVGVRDLDVDERLRS